MKFTQSIKVHIICVVVKFEMNKSRLQKRFLNEWAIQYCVLRKVKTSKHQTYSANKSVHQKLCVALILIMSVRRNLSVSGCIKTA